MAAIEYRQVGEHSTSKRARRWAYRLVRRLFAFLLVILFDAAVVVAVLFLTGIVRY